MTHEKILKREDGSHVKISIRPYFDSVRFTMEYKTDVSTKAPKKRTWINTVNTDDFAYRKVEFEKRGEYEKQIHLQYVSEDELYEAHLEVWEKLKPQK